MERLTSPPAAPKNSGLRLAQLETKLLRYARAQWESKSLPQQAAVKGEKQLGFWSQLPPGVCPRSGFVRLDVFQRKRFPQSQKFLVKVLYVARLSKTSTYASVRHGGQSCASADATCEG